MLTELSAISAELGHINNSHFMPLIFDRPRFDSCGDSKFGPGIFFWFSWWRCLWNSSTKHQKIVSKLLANNNTSSACNQSALSTGLLRMQSDCTASLALLHSMLTFHDIAYISRDQFSGQITRGAKRLSITKNARNLMHGKFDGHKYCVF